MSSVDCQTRTGTTCFEFGAAVNKEIWYLKKMPGRRIFTRNKDIDKEYGTREAFTGSTLGKINNVQFS